MQRTTRNASILLLLSRVACVDNRRYGVLEKVISMVAITL